PLTFQTTGLTAARGIEFKPLYSFTDNYYSVYWDQFTMQTWGEQQAAYEAEQQRLRELEARTIDIVRFGEMQPERDHNLQGEHTRVGEANDRTYREADERGWFSFEMKVNPETENTLMFTYWGSERGRKMFDILVDGEKIGTQELNDNDAGKFFDVAYVLTGDKLKGKQSVTVKLIALPGKRIGAVYAARIVKE
ncbi:MAG TPA: glycoside hydrolase family 127 protein, partial [Cyclobacteriaceae bacterium]|nr:glycoside hydrolase family 127 protein [Cyclobacteriaceae bacterium]